MPQASFQSHPAPMLVLCPLEYEARGLRRALGDADIPVACCGPGPSALERWMRGAMPAAEPRLIVLAGLAGALRDDRAPGLAYLVTEVRDASGAIVGRSPWVPLAPDGGIAQATLTQDPGIIVDRAARTTLARSSGADLVDQESVAFARLVQARGWPWLIIRGVSDDAASPLPADAGAWVDADGRTRPIAAAGWLLRQPWQALALARLHRRSAAALRACAAVVRQVAALDRNEGLNSERRDG